MTKTQVVSRTAIKLQWNETMKPDEVFEHLENDLDTHKKQVIQALNRYAHKGRTVMFQILPMREPVPGEITSHYVDFDARPRIKVKNLSSGKERLCGPEDIKEWCWAP